MITSGFRAFAFTAGALLAVVVAQAQQPPQNSSSTAAAPSSSPAASHQAQKPAASTGAAQKAADPSPVLLRDAANAGFKPEHIRGTLMFCRTAIELGSNFPVRTCYNEEQVKIKIHEYQVERNQLEQQHNLGMGVH